MEFNELLKHFQELTVFLKNNEIDVCRISEIHFTKELCDKTKGYQIYHLINRTANLTPKGDWSSKEEVGDSM